MRKMRWFLSVLTVVILLVSAFPFAASAETGYPRLNTEEHVKYINGKENGFFRPGANITRAETAKILYELLTEKPGVIGGAFTDVSAGAWYAGPVNTLASLEILKGYGDVFKPNNGITRAEFVTILSRFYPLESGENRFNDVPQSHWAYNAIISAAQKGWVTGYDGGLFKPNNKITRAEAVAIINRVLGRKADRKTIDQAKIYLFPDVAPTHWAYYEIVEASTEHKHSTLPAGGKEETWYTYTHPLSTVGPGFLNIDGALYCVEENGSFAYDKTIGNLYFGKNFQYTSGDAEIDALAKKIVREQINGNMTQMERLEAVYDYVCNNYNYRGGDYIGPTVKDWENQSAKEMYKNKYGNCYSYAAIFTVLARQAGYEAYGISGRCYRPDNQWVLHGWTEILLDGETYICDPQMESVYGKQQGFRWRLLMVKPEDSPLQYEQSDD